MKYYMLSSLFFFLSITVGKAQVGLNNNQIEYLSQYYFNQVLYNPAFTGDTLQPSLGVSTRYEKAGNNNKPLILNAYVHTFVESAKSGFGLAINYQPYRNEYNENILKLSFLYSYQLDVGTDGYFRLGFNTSLLHYNTNRIPFFNNPNNPVPIQVIQVNERFFKYNMDFGVLFQKRAFQIGLGLMHSNEPSFEFYAPSTAQIFYKQAYATISYDLELSDDILIKPHLMFNQRVTNQYFRYFGNNAQLDVGVLARFQDRYFGGIQYKTQQTPYRLSFMAGAKINDLIQVSLAYDLKSNKAYTNYSRVEMSLGYNFR